MAPTLESECRALRERAAAIARQFGVSVTEVTCIAFASADADLARTQSLDSSMRSGSRVSYVPPQRPAGVRASVAPRVYPNRCSVSDDGSRGSLGVHIASVGHGSVAARTDEESKVVAAMAARGVSDSWLGPLDFGVEIEAILMKRPDEIFFDNNVKAIQQVVPALVRDMGSGLDIGFVHYDDAKADRVYAKWKVTTDLSLRSEDGRPVFGLEFVTPKLRGVAGLDLVQRFSASVARQGFVANSTASVHVHVSCRPFTNEQVRRFAQYLVCYESVLDQYITVPRRMDYSRYARSVLRSISWMRSAEEAVEKLASVRVDLGLAPLVALVNPPLAAPRNSERNHKVNFTLLRGTKTGSAERRVEFRQHHGTMDPHEVVDWATLVTRFVYVSCTAAAPPTPKECTEDSFWALIDAPELRDRFDFYKEALDVTVDFAYDSRELYATYGDAYRDQVAEEEASPDDVPDEPELGPGLLRSLSLATSQRIEHAVAATDTRNGSAQHAWQASLANRQHSFQQLRHSIASGAVPSIGDTARSTLLRSELRGSVREATDTVSGRKASGLEGVPRAPLRGRVEMEWYSPDMQFSDLQAAVVQGVVDTCDTEILALPMEIPGDHDDCWVFTKTAVTVARLVRALSGVRVVSPLTSVVSSLAEALDIASVIDDRSSPSASTAVFYHFDVSDVSDAQLHRCLIFLTLCDTAVGRVMAAVCPVNIVQYPVSPWQQYLEHCQSKVPPGAVLNTRVNAMEKLLSMSHQTDAFAGLVELLNPKKLRTSADRPFTMRFDHIAGTKRGDPERVVVFRSTLDVDQMLGHMAFLTQLVHHGTTVSSATLDGFVRDHPSCQLSSAECYDAIGLSPDLMAALP